MRPRIEQIALTGAAVVLGVMLALGFRLQRDYGITLQDRRWDQLAVLLAQAERERDDLRSEVTTLRAQLGETGTTPEQGTLLKQIQLVAGFAPGTGPGIQVTLDDSQRASQGGENPNLFLLHDDDILRVVNELTAAGAEAIAINGQRNIATTEIRCAGPVISVNNTRVAPPIQIVAIGDPATLESALRMRGGVLEILTAIGIQVQIQRSEGLRVPAYGGGVTARYLREDR